MAVVLAIDEFHLDIRSDGDLIGRYYLADVEVARDIAERFILFLGDDEMEFLADDALQFAYDGVSAMQEAWLAAQKKKRRHKKAAAESARRKEEDLLAAATPPVEVQRKKPANAPQSELAKRIAAATQAEEAARRAKPSKKKAPAPVKAEPDDEETRREDKAVRPAAIKRNQPAITATKRPRPPAQDPILDAALESVEEMTAVEALRGSSWSNSQTAIDDESSTPQRVSKNGKHPIDLEEVSTLPLILPDQEAETSSRYAPHGHHPAETSVGLLSRLRRQPKVPDDHIHKFQMSNSGVGLVRRVCTECSYVSIGSDD